MRQKLLLCEHCENMVSVLNNKKETFVCPLCGTINERIREQKFDGYVKIISHKTKCVINSDSDSDISFSKLNDDEQEALSVLSYWGWRIVFVKGDPKQEPPANEIRKF